MGRNTLLPTLQVRGARGQGVSGLHSLWERCLHAEVWSSEATDCCVDLDPGASGSVQNLRWLKQGQGLSPLQQDTCFTPLFPEDEVAPEILSLPVLGDQPC